MTISFIAGMVFISIALFIIGFWRRYYRLKFRADWEITDVV